MVRITCHRNTTRPRVGALLPPLAPQNDLRRPAAAVPQLPVLGYATRMSWPSGASPALGVPARVLTDRAAAVVSSPKSFAGAGKSAKKTSETGPTSKKMGNKQGSGPIVQYAPRANPHSHPSARATRDRHPPSRPRARAPCLTGQRQHSRASMCAIRASHIAAEMLRAQLERAHRHGSHSWPRPLSRTRAGRVRENDDGRANLRLRESEQLVRPE